MSNFEHPAHSDPPSETQAVRARERLRRPRPRLVGAWVWFAIGALAAVWARDLWDRGSGGPGDRDRRALSELRALVERSYPDPAAGAGLLDDALDGALRGLDAHSRYYNGEEAKALDRATEGSFFGLGLYFSDVGGAYRVLYPLPGSPAEKAGLRPGDRLLAVDGSALLGSGAVQLSAHLEEKRGRELSLLVERRGGERFNVSLAATRLLEPTIFHGELVGPAGDVGHVVLRQFSRRTPEELDQTLSELDRRGMKSLVLDLRANRGGVLQAATLVANRFVDAGVLVEVRSRNGVEQTRADAKWARWKQLPLVVLVDRETASAAEVLAAALQEHRAAVLLGERTFGKGTVQSVTRLRSAGGLAKITSAVYRTPSGRSLDAGPDGPGGLAPDLEVALDREQRASVLAWLEGPGPPIAYLEELRAWEREAGIALVPTRPEDPQLDAALSLLTRELASAEGR